jgi:deoxyribonuclease II
VDSWIALAQNAEYQYYFHDPVNGFVKSPYRTNQTSEGSIMSTIAQLYSQDLDLNNVAYALYNDDPPPPLDVTSSTYAHSKGVVLFDHESGFWLVHSKPNWPNQRSGGPIPFPDSTYAQSLMCITMNSSMFDTVASGFLINYPYIYDSYMSANLESQLPIFKSWIAGGKSTVTNMTYEVTSRAGKPFLQFAKSKSWGRDLYDDFVAPVLNESIFVETWRSGSGGRMGSVCENSDDDTWTVHPSSYDIIEVSLVTMPDGDSWKGTSDHSKWVRSSSCHSFLSSHFLQVSTIDPGAICIGDINRMCSQVFLSPLPSSSLFVLIPSRRRAEEEALFVSLTRR